LLPLVDALPELMTPASAALGVPALTEPGEWVGQGWASESTISGVSGLPKGNRTVVNVEDFPAIRLAVVA